jgi:cytochrome P450
MIYRLIQQRQTSGEPNDDLLELFLPTPDELSGETLNWQQVRDQVATLLGVGHETTAAAMTWFWYALAQHPLVTVVSSLSGKFYQHWLPFLENASYQIV